MKKLLVLMAFAGLMVACGGAPKSLAQKAFEARQSGNEAAFGPIMEQIYLLPAEEQQAALEEFYSLVSEAEGHIEEAG